MATWIQKLIWTALTWIVGGVSSWSTLSGTTETYSSVVDLETNGYDGAEIFPEVEFDASPTDDVDLNVYGHNGTKRDDTPFAAFTIGKETDPNQASFTVTNRTRFVIGFQQTGSTDSHNVRASYKAWRGQADSA